MLRKSGPQVKGLWSYRAYKLFWVPWPGDLEITSTSLNVELDLHNSVMHMRWKNEDPKSRRHDVIALTGHFGFRDLVVLKLGQGHWMSNLAFRSMSCTWGKKIKLSRLQASAPSAHPPLVITIPHSLNGWGVKMKPLGPGVMKLSLFWSPSPGDLKNRQRALNLKLDIQVSVIHKSCKNKGPQSRSYEIIALTSIWFSIQLSIQ